MAFALPGLPDRLHACLELERLASALQPLKLSAVTQALTPGCFYVQFSF